MYNFCLLGLVFQPYFLQVPVDVKALGPPHVLKRWLEAKIPLLLRPTIMKFKKFDMVESIHPLSAVGLLLDLYYILILIYIYIY